jgi:hypothetical protein
MSTSFAGTLAQVSALHSSAPYVEGSCRRIARKIFSNDKDKPLAGIARPKRVVILIKTVSAALSCGYTLPQSVGRSLCCIHQARCYMQLARAAALKNYSATIKGTQCNFTHAPDMLLHQLQQHMQSLNICIHPAIKRSQLTAVHK